jgi:hypothetical protein
MRYGPYTAKFDNATGWWRVSVKDTTASFSYNPMFNEKPAGELFLWHIERFERDIKVSFIPTRREPISNNFTDYILESQGCIPRPPSGFTAYRTVPDCSLEIETEVQS